MNEPTQEQLKNRIKQVTLEITVHRASTGKDEHYGIVSAYHKNPIKNLLMQIDIKYRAWRRKHGDSFS